MKLLALSALVCALMALTLAADAGKPEAQPEPKSELQVAKAENPVVEKRFLRWIWKTIRRWRKRRRSRRRHLADVEKRTFCWHWRPRWTLIGHRYFLYVRQCLTWHQAERKCRSLGGHLASVHSGWEYQQIRNLIARHNRNHPQAWIGGTDQRCEGHWKWSDGSCFNYRGWCPGEPNNAGNQDCLQMNFTSRKCWDDLQCNRRLPFVCVRNRRW